VRRKSDFLNQAEIEFLTSSSTVPNIERSFLGGAHLCAAAWSSQKVAHCDAFTSLVLLLALA